MCELEPVSIELTLFNDESVKKKLTFMNCLEAMFDDERNILPNEYYNYSDELPLGTKIRITFEVI